MGVGSEQRGSGVATRLSDVVVGIDGSDESLTALRWAVGVVGPAGRVRAVSVVEGADRSATSEREAVLRERWIGEALAVLPPDRATVDAVVLGGDPPEELIRYAGEVDADAVVVGHHHRAHFGPRLVGHVTADLLRAADRPVVIVPSGWNHAVTAERPVVVGVGAVSATEAAIRWALAQPEAVAGGLLLVHAYGARSVFRPDGWLDVLAYFLDPTVLPEWVEEDLLDLADRVSEETGVDVEVNVSVGTGRAGARLVDAGEGAGLLVVGRGEPPFVREHTIAPYLHHAIVHAPCPVVVVPVADD